MSSGLYGVDELTELVTERSVLDGTFECLRRIWSKPDALESQTLTDSKYRTRLLEHHLSA